MSKIIDKIMGEQKKRGPKKDKRASYLKFIKENPNHLPIAGEHLK